MIVPEIKVVPDPGAVALEAASRIVDAAEKCISKNGTFSIALSGGSTPKVLYELLASDAFRTRIDWSRVHIFFGDERRVPPDDPQSNYGMALKAMLSKVPLPGDNIYRIHGEIDPNEAAKEYGQTLQEHFGDGGIDLVLLGMGPDGHTASLFPGTEALKEKKHRCVANFVPKFNSWRVTLTVPFINRAGAVMVLLGGADKAERLNEVLEGPRDPDRLPIQYIAPDPGTMTWIIDVAAAEMDKA